MNTPINRRVEPTVSLLNGMAYTNSASTDLKAKFALLREQMKQPQANVQPIRAKRKT
jgi:hypothetical protein